MRDWAGRSPCITCVTDSLHDWDPPFPIDLKLRATARDEHYWKKYRTTPSNFLITARRRAEVNGLPWLALRQADPHPAAWLDRRFRRRGFGLRLEPHTMGFRRVTLHAQQAHRLIAGRDAILRLLYFVYSASSDGWPRSFLAALFFRARREQRLREIGMLRACRFPDALCAICF